MYEEWKRGKLELNKEEQEDGFYELMQEARSKSKQARITKRTPTSQPNRTPYFLACLEDLCGLKEE